MLQGINLEVQAGEFVAIIDKSGSGKSTLLRLISALDLPDVGEIRVDDQPLRNCNEYARIMFQDARLLPWRRVLDNVGIGSQGNWREAASEVLSHVGLSDRSGEWPNVLSGGER